MGLVVVIWCCLSSPCSYFLRTHCDLWYRWVCYNGMDHAEWNVIVKYRSETYFWTQKLNREDYGVDKYWVILFCVSLLWFEIRRLRLRFWAGWDWPKMATILFEFYVKTILTVIWHVITPCNMTTSSIQLSKKLTRSTGELKWTHHGVRICFVYYESIKQTVRIVINPLIYRD